MLRDDTGLPKRLHPLLARARRRVALTFLSLTTLAYLAVLTVWRPSGGPFWEAYQYAAMVLLIGLFTFQIALGAAARAVPVGKTVLILRRFHTDPLATRRGLLFADQQLRMAPFFENLALAGHRIVTLRDTMLIGDIHLAVYWSPLILLANMLSPLMVTYFGLLFAVEWVLSRNGASNPTLQIVLLSYFGATIFLFLFPGVRRWFSRYTQSYMQFTRRWFLRGHSPRGLQQLARLLARRRAGLTAIRSTDANWRDFARMCIETADAICFDLRSPSENCDAEVLMIAEARAGGKVVWLAPEEDTNAVRYTPEGYVVRGVTLPGAPLVLSLPETTKPGLFLEDRRFLRRLSALLHQIDAAAAR